MPHLGISAFCYKGTFMNKFFNDEDQLLLDRITNVYDIPPYVNLKEASDKRPNISDFAYPEKELYPINSPTKTALSFCYASEDNSIPADIKRRVIASIKNAAEFWNISLPAKKEKTDSISSLTYTIKVSSDSGTDIYDIHNDSELKEVVAYIQKNAADLSYNSRKQIAAAVLNAPAEFKKQLTRQDVISLQRTSGDMFVTPSDVKVACEIRAQYASSMGHDDVASMLRDFGNMQPAKLNNKMVTKIASILDFADRLTGMTCLYKDGKLALPEHSINGVARADVELFVDKTIGMKNGSAFVKNDIVNEKNKVVSFFKDYTGEDLSKASDADIFVKIASLDETGANAFQELTGLGVFNK